MFVLLFLFFIYFKKKQECDNLIDSEIDQIVQWLKQGDNATTICTNLGVCPGGGALCSVCTLVFGVLDEILPNGAGEGIIKIVLQEICATVKTRIVSGLLF